MNAIVETKQDNSISFLDQHFECTRMHTKLSRSSCIAQYEKGLKTSNAKPGEEAVTVWNYVRCKGCTVGAAHKRKEAHPDAPNVTITGLISKSKLPKKQRKCLHCSKPLMKRGRAAFCDNFCRDSYSDSYESTARYVESVERTTDIQAFSW